MKKNIFFLIAFMLAFILCTKTVYAQEHQFYEAEYINKIYMSKYEYSTNTIYYQQARFFRNTITGEHVYCIEPFIFFQDGSIYQETNVPRNLSEEQMNKIKKIIYYGYQYADHWDPSWYAVTQLMIWKVANPNEGDYYFTETLNGARTNKYDYQIDIINQLINTHDVEIPIKDQTFTIVEGMSKEIIVGDILNQYTTTNQEIELQNQKIIIKKLSEGEYKITLSRTLNNYYKPQILYGSPNSQYMIGTGDLEPQIVSFIIKVISNHIVIKKIDETTNSFTPMGDASLIGSIYELYNEENQLIKTIEITQEEEFIKNIPFGTYYLKEKTPGKGYTLNEITYQINLSEINPNKEIIVTNKVIEKKIIIKKQYGTEENFKPEKNIIFEIYNSKDELIDSLTTNEQGEAEITLSYGNYKLIQKNTTEGYQQNEPMNIQIDNQEKEIIEIYDYKIPVPNTHTNRMIYLWTIIKRWLHIY